ncbi:MAG: polymerase III, delta prime subunit protein [Candidatus Woesebacteria bacterium GW2011_GWB1_38_5b]|uniref:Polymerase III, delta prime subunit protein n=1 Tax=Candidatus Woesebacteria bacterium GW2011_GWB1_38_5b TaxID=1618569 RepID=A0A0G0NAT7_9BACT|nr:MAG: polymerase III, delta prime subunit protein [Candidatus Woesebacteria bacterium GW2011_GWB1_38_5b]OGH47512.1 MAG: hypothetical protein A3A51_02900 [Candidatus Levybacteria bacterium RIFCSPLOWO2_01_FULL_39_10]
MKKEEPAKGQYPRLNEDKGAKPCYDVQTFIISSKNIEEGKNRALEEINLEKIDKFDIELLESEKAIGIEDVRNIQKRIYLLPIRGTKKAFIISCKQGITTEAQNSMLKILEEPPPSTLLYLITDNYNFFLPTIISRAKIIEIKDSEARTDGKGLAELLSLTGVGDCLYLAQELSKDKNQAINWLEQTILAARKKMLSTLDNSEQSLMLERLIRKLELARLDLKNTNANPRLALENLFLNIN